MKWGIFVGIDVFHHLVIRKVFIRCCSAIRIFICVDVWWLAGWLGQTIEISIFTHNILMHLIVFILNKFKEFILWILCWISICQTMWNFSRLNQAKSYCLPFKNAHFHQHLNLIFSMVHCFEIHGKSLAATKMDEIAHNPPFFTFWKAKSFQWHFTIKIFDIFSY